MRVCKSLLALVCLVLVASLALAPLGAAAEKGKIDLGHYQ